MLGRRPRLRGVRAVMVHLVGGMAALLVAGPNRRASTVAPLTEAVGAGSLGPGCPSARRWPTAALANLGALLALIAGVGRTSLAMARPRPGWPPCTRDSGSPTTPKPPSPSSWPDALFHGADAETTSGD